METNFLTEHRSKTIKAIEIFIAFLVLLWSYTALSKLVGFEEFRGQMLNQPLPSWMGAAIAWILPVTELAVAGLLLTRYRMAALYSSLALMLAFTGYIALLLLNVFGRVPCSCGGIISDMSFEAHLIFNILVTVTICIGILLTHKQRRAYCIKTEKSL